MTLELTWKDFYKFKKYNKRMNNYNISLTNNLFKEVNIVFSKQNKSTQVVPVIGDIADLLKPDRPYF